MKKFPPLWRIDESFHLFVLLACVHHDLDQTLRLFLVHKITLLHQLHPRISILFHNFDKLDFDSPPISSSGSSAMVTCKTRHLHTSPRGDEVYDDERDVWS